LRGVTYAGVWWGTLRKKDQFEDLGIDGSVMLKWILGAWKV